MQFIARCCRIATLFAYYILTHKTWTICFQPPLCVRYLRCSHLRQIVRADDARAGAFYARWAMLWLCLNELEIKIAVFTSNTSVGLYLRWVLLHLKFASFTEPLRLIKLTASFRIWSWKRPVSAHSDQNQNCIVSLHFLWLCLFQPLLGAIAVYVGCGCRLWCARPNKTHLRESRLLQVKLTD